MKRLARSIQRHVRQLGEELSHYRGEWSVERDLERIVTRGRTLVVGPWLSEVGYETLYWIPFLRWVQVAFRVDPSRVVAVSRGGVSSWYSGIANRYVEIWDLIDPAEYAARNAERGEVKQASESQFDRDLVTGVGKRLGTSEIDVLHPSLMYRLFALFWSGHRSMSLIDSHTRFARIAAPQVIDPALLPSEYVAVKFYSARALPGTAEVTEQLSSMLTRLALETPVVLLDTGLVLDEHEDHDLVRGGRVVSARSWMTPRTNLAVQTQIIAGAKAFVGTCGSVAWLAPMLDVDTSAVYVDPKWLHAHFAVALRAYHRMGAGRFSLLDLRALAPLDAAETRRSEKAPART